MNTPINTNIMETNIKSTYVFNNIWIASKLRVVKVSPKSDMAIVWIDIWDIQSGNLAKMLINRFFNVESYVITIYGVNMSPNMLQYKNCWKWGHMTFTCRFQGSKYIRYNSSHKIEHYYHFTWCCKANFKGDYQVDSNTCLFWKYWFNKE